MKKYLIKLQRCSFEGMFCSFSCQTFGYLGFSGKKCRYTYLKKPHFLSSKEMACHPGLGTQGPSSSGQKAGDGLSTTM